MDEQGSVLPLMAMLVGVAMVFCVTLGMLAQRAVARAEAQAAADAVALAGAVEGESGATELAARNEATLVSFIAADSVILVVVERYGVRATAAATRQARSAVVETNQTDP